MKFHKSASKHFWTPASAGVTLRTTLVENQSWYFLERNLVLIAPRTALRALRAKTIASPYWIEPDSHQTPRPAEVGGLIRHACDTIIYQRAGEFFAKSSDLCLSIPKGGGRRIEGNGEILRIL